MSELRLEQVFSMKKGLVYVFTGEGKGKTSAGLGMALRAISWGEKVAVVGWYKRQAKLKTQNSKLEVYGMGKGFYKKNSKKAKLVSNCFKYKISDDTELNKRLAEKALKKVGELFKSKKYFLIVLDEVLHAIKDGLLSLGEVLEVVEERRRTHVVLTGRFDTLGMSKLLERVDLVTECKKIKHPFDLGKKAVKGLDY